MSALGRGAALAVAIGVTILVVVGVRQPAAPRGEAHRVTMENMKFSPAEIEIQLGETIEFVNADLTPHTATAKTGQAFDSDMLKSGGTWSFSPQQPGIIEYQCKFHPMMQGKIIVR